MEVKKFHYSPISILDVSINLRKLVRSYLLQFQLGISVRKVPKSCREIYDGRELGVCYLGKFFFHKNECCICGFDVLLQHELVRMSCGKLLIH